MKLAGLLCAALIVSTAACLGGVAGSDAENGAPSAPTGPSEPRREPKKIGSPTAPASQTVPFYVIVSNQSFDVSPVDIDVYVDGVHAISGDFDVGSQHTFLSFDFGLAPGEHTLRVVSAKGASSAESRFTLQETKRWSVVMFWKEGSSGSFTIDFQDKPPAFQ